MYSNMKCLQVSIAVVIVASSLVVGTPVSHLDKASPYGAVDGNTSTTLVNCPTWFVPALNSSLGCKCGSEVGGIVLCYKEGIIHLHSCYCISHLHEDKTALVVGACLFSCAYHEQCSSQYKIPPDPSEMNDAACKDFNRQGQLCGQCRDGYAPPVYTFYSHCVKCSDYSHNWIKYILVAFLPLTLFYLIVIVCRISVTSAPMNAFVLVTQILSTPLLMQVIAIRLHIQDLSPQSKLPVVILSSLLNVWNLDFFRLAYEPFCLHPKMTTLQALSLDYVVAGYPLLLIGITFLLVELHDRDFRLIVWLWRPYHRCFVRFRRQWDIRTSLIDAFATFFLLSYVKLLSVTHALLIPTSLHNVHGKQLEKSFLFYNGEVEYFGKEHLPYGIVAVVVLVVFIISPLVLLCLYPCRCVQRCLNKCRFQCRVLHTFMDVFQGGYKDGTNGTRDCRYFAAVYLMLRILFLIAAAVTLSEFLFPLAASAAVIVAMLVALIQPYKSSVYNTINVVLILAFGFVCIGIMASTVAYTKAPEFKHVANVLGGVPVFILLGYITGLVLYLLLIRTRCLHRFLHRALHCLRGPPQRANSEESLPDRYLHPEEYGTVLVANCRSTS